MFDVTGVSTGVIERYLECLAAHDWDGLISRVSVFFKQRGADKT